MTNIIPMFSNNTALTAIRSHGYGEANFDIATTPLVYFADEYRTKFPSSKSVIYRTDTGQELGVHGHGYKAVAPKHMIDVTRNIIERSDLSINGMEETIRTSHDGSRTFVKYRLPEHTYKTSDGDTASLSLLAITISLPWRRSEHLRTMRLHAGLSASLCLYSDIFIWSIIVALV